MICNVTAFMDDKSGLSLQYICVNSNLIRYACTCILFKNVHMFENKYNYKNYDILCHELMTKLNLGLLLLCIKFTYVFVNEIYFNHYNSVCIDDLLIHMTLSFYNLVFYLTIKCKKDN